MLKKALEGVLEKDEIELLSSAFDVIGDIAIIKIPDILSSKQELIGREILSRMKNVRTVLRQRSDVQGEFRTRDLSFVTGEEKYETICKESGCLFKVDVKEVYFSPRLSTERERIASLVREGEHIFNMFAGVGTFSLVIAKKKGGCVIESVDKNPRAIELAFESLKLNKKLKSRVNPVLADAAEYASQNKETFDRILMPLPERAREFLPAAFGSSRDGAIIHYYVHVPENDFKDDGWISKHLESITGKGNRKYEILKWKKVREVGPKFIQAVADIKIGSSQALTI